MSGHGFYVALIGRKRFTSENLYGEPVEFGTSYVKPGTRKQPQLPKHDLTKLGKGSDADMQYGSPTTQYGSPRSYAGDTPQIPVQSRTFTKDLDTYRKARYIGDRSDSISSQDSYVSYNSHQGSEAAGPSSDRSGTLTPNGVNDNGSYHQQQMQRGSGHYLEHRSDSLKENEPSGKKYRRTQSDVYDLQNAERKRLNKSKEESLMSSGTSVSSGAAVRRSQFARQGAVVKETMPHVDEADMIDESGSSTPRGSISDQPIEVPLSVGASGSQDHDPIPNNPARREYQSTTSDSDSNIPPHQLIARLKQLKKDKKSHEVLRGLCHLRNKWGLKSNENAPNMHKSLPETSTNSSDIDVNGNMSQDAQTNVPKAQTSQSKPQSSQPQTITPKRSEPGQRTADEPVSKEKQVLDDSHRRPNHPTRTSRPSSSDFSSSSTESLHKGTTQAALPYFDSRTGKLVKTTSPTPSKDKDQGLLNQFGRRSFSGKTSRSQDQRGSRGRWSGSDPNIATASRPQHQQQQQYHHIASSSSDVSGSERSLSDIKESEPLQTTPRPSSRRPFTSHDPLPAADVASQAPKREVVGARGPSAQTWRGAQPRAQTENKPRDSNTDIKDNTSDLDNRLRERDKIDSSVTMQTVGVAQPAFGQPNVQVSKPKVLGYDPHGVELPPPGQGQYYRRREDRRLRHRDSSGSLSSTDGGGQSAEGSAHIAKNQMFPNYTDYTPRKPPISPRSPRSHHSSKTSTSREDDQKLVSPRSRAGEEDSNSFVFTVPDDEPTQKHAYHGPGRPLSFEETDTIPVRGQHSTVNAPATTAANKPIQDTPNAHPHRLPSYPSSGSVSSSSYQSMSDQSSFNQTPPPYQRTGQTKHKPPPIQVPVEEPQVSYKDVKAQLSPVRKNQISPSKIGVNQRFSPKSTRKTNTAIPEDLAKINALRKAFAPSPDGKQATGDASGALRVLKGRVQSHLSPSSSRSESLSPSPIVQPAIQDPPSAIHKGASLDNIVKPIPKSGLTTEATSGSAQSISSISPTSTIGSTSEKSSETKSASQLRKERLKKEQEKLQQRQLQKKKEQEEDLRRKQQIREQQEALEKQRIIDEEKRFEEEQKIIQEEIKRIEEEERLQQIEEKHRKEKEEIQKRKQVEEKIKREQEREKKQREEKIKREKEERERKLREEKMKREQEERERKLREEKIKQEQEERARKQREEKRKQEERERLQKQEEARQKKLEEDRKLEAIRQEKQRQIETRKKAEELRRQRQLEQQKRLEEAKRKKDEDEKKRQETLRKQKELEQKKLEQEKKIAEAKRKEELKRQKQLEEQRRQDELRRQKLLEEQKRRDEIKRQKDLQEQKRQEEIKKQRELEEQKRQEEIKRKKEIEEKKRKELEEKKRQEEKKRLEEQIRKQKVEEEKKQKALDQQKQLENERIKKAMEEQRRKEEMEQIKKRKQEEEEQKRKEQEEQRKRQILEEQKRRELEEQRRQQLLEEQKKRKEQEQQKRLQLEKQRQEEQMKLLEQRRKEQEILKQQELQKAKELREQRHKEDQEKVRQLKQLQQQKLKQKTVSQQESLPTSPLSPSSKSQDNDLSKQSLDSLAGTQQLAVHEVETIKANTAMQVDNTSMNQHQSKDNKKAITSPAPGKKSVTQSQTKLQTQVSASDSDFDRPLLPLVPRPRIDEDSDSTDSSSISYASSTASSRSNRRKYRTRHQDAATRQQLGKDIHIKEDQISPRPHRRKKKDKSSKRKSPINRLDSPSAGPDPNRRSNDDSSLASDSSSSTRRHLRGRGLRNQTTPITNEELEQAEGLNKNSNEQASEMPRTKKDISELVKKFSDVSSSESESGTKKRIVIRRKRSDANANDITTPSQETVSTNATLKLRRTPERSQSFNVRKSPSPEKVVVLRRSGSLRGTDPSKQPASKIQDNELAKILNRRSRVLEQDEEQANKLEELENKLEEEKKERLNETNTVADAELSSMLKARRLQEDSPEEPPPTESSPSDSIPKQNERQIAETHSNDKTSQQGTIIKTNSLEKHEQPTVKPIINIEDAKPKQSILKKDSIEESKPETKSVPTLQKDAPSAIENSSKPNGQKPKSILKKSSSEEEVSLRTVLNPQDNDTPQDSLAVPSKSPRIVSPILGRKLPGGAELASVLEARRQLESESEQEENQEESGAISPSFMPQDGEEKPLSVAERIFQMKNKIEESNSKSGSGFGTPRTGAISPIPPRQEGSPPDLASFAPTIAEDQELLDKLSDVAANREKFQNIGAKRDRFQKLKNEDWRRKTQPVTLEELVKAESLDSVAAFRAEVMRKASTNLFKEQQTSKTKVPLVKGPVLSHPTSNEAEFPQPFSREKEKRRFRRKGDKGRYNTLPISLEDLSGIPETDTLNITKSKSFVELQTESIKEQQTQSFADIQSKFKSKDKPKRFAEKSKSFKDKQTAFLQQAKQTETPGATRPPPRRQLSRGMTPETDDNLDDLCIENISALKSEEEEEALRQLTLEMEVSDDDLTRLSVNAKSSVFSTKEQEEKAEAEIEHKPKKIKPAAKRFFRKRRDKERSQTQPVTIEEVKSASDIAKQEQVQDDSSEDELSQLSIAEKMKLFSAKKKSKPPPKVTTPVMKRKQRREKSRFQTQPVTNDEMQAAKISPLAMTLVKPPDPEILGGLRLKDQWELMAKHAEATLSHGSRPGSRSGSQTGSRPGSQPGSRSGSQPGSRSGSRTTSMTELTTSDDVDQPGTVAQHEPKQQVEENLETKQIPPIKGSIDNSNIKGILKPSTQSANNSDNVHSETVRSILKPEIKSSPERHLVSSSEDNKSATDEMTSQVTSQLGSYRQSVVENLSIEPSVIKVDERDQLSSSAEEEIRATKHIKNEAIAARRRSREMRKFQHERYHTQPIEGSGGEESPSSGRRAKPVTARHMTQPITPTEKEEAAENAFPDPLVKNKLGGSIADRLSNLHKSGETEWQKRLLRQGKSPSPEVEIKFRNKPWLKGDRPTSIHDRLNHLKESSETWKQRVEEKDSEEFTVAGKLAKTGKQALPDTPVRLPPKSRISPRGSSFKLTKSGTESGDESLAFKNTPLPKSISLGDLNALVKSNSDEDKKKPEAPKTEVTEKKEVHVPSVNNEEFTAFFKSNLDKNLDEKLDVTVDDFDHLFIESNEMLLSTRKIRPQKRKAAGSRNPLKALSTHQNLQQTYTEVKTDIAEKEFKRVNKEKISVKAGLAEAALAGLASTEDFAKVNLRRSDSGNTTRKMQPYKDLMLMQIKGRRHVQTRLVAPTASSINSGDCFILVTSDRVFCWLGEYANVIEKAKANELADMIQKKKEMGCKCLKEAAIIPEKRQHLGQGKVFWELLGGKKPYEDMGPAEEDELYEMYMVETNAVYKVGDKKELVPYQEYWGSLPKYEMLDSKEVFVFDFGSELYVWQGKQATFEKRKLSLQLAQKLWETEYDYTNCNINPISPLHTEENGGVPDKNNKRPDWALLGKVNQNMETLLFREKFSDWPDQSRLIAAKSRENPAENTNKPEAEALKAFDAKLMVAKPSNPVDLVLEGSHVGRGTKWLEDLDGIFREFEIVTLDVQEWHVLEYEHNLIAKPSHGQFHEGDTYVVRWQYMITQSGMKSLKGTASRHGGRTGREKCAYFFWQGQGSSITEKGASALMTVELDEERGPQVRVVQGRDPPCFLNLFDLMIIHIGKREEEETNTQGPWRLYLVRNELANESYLVEVKCFTTSLRSRASFLLLNVKTGLLYVWHGCKSPESARVNALGIANKLKKRCPEEVGLHEDASIIIAEMEEGEEKNSWWVALEEKDQSIYNCLLKVSRPFTHTLRLFYMSSVSGVFEATELLNPARQDDVCSPFPFTQDDLYKASQPALFLVESDDCVYLWQGWWPEDGEGEENIKTGSAIARFNIDRKCAMETTLNYCKEIGRPETDAYLVYGGQESVTFTNLFPTWTDSNEARQAQIKDGKKSREPVPVKQILARLSRSRYSLEELQQEELPDGVDPGKLETYLSEEDFLDVLGIKRSEFNDLPGWKQTSLKRESGLF